MSNLLNSELLMKNKCQNKASQNKKVMAKRVDLFVVGAPHNSVTPHAPDDRQRACNEHQLHHSVV